MGMVNLIISTGAVMVLAAVSLAAGRSIAPGARVPMQWGLDGRPTWSAPRGIALAFTPVTASLVLGLMTVLVPDDGRGLAAVLSTAALFIAAHLVHLSWARRARD